MPRDTPPAGRRYRGASGDERRDERRQKLIDAAIEVFGTRGYHGSTVRSICVAAGLTERYFYESFANSEDLLAATFDFLTDRLRRDLAAAVRAAPRDPDAIIRAVLDRLFRRVQDDPHGARIQFFEILGVSPRIDGLYRNAMHEFGMMLIDMARRVLGADALADIDEEMLAAASVGAVVLMGHRWVLSGYAKPRATVVDSAHTIFMAVTRQLAR